MLEHCNTFSRAEAEAEKWLKEEKTTRKMQQKLSRGCRTALALLMACSLLLVGTVAADADDFDDGIVEDVQVSQFPKK